MKYVLELFLIIVIISSIAFVSVNELGVNDVNTINNDIATLTDYENKNNITRQTLIEKMNKSFVKDSEELVTSNGKDLYIGKIINGKNETLYKTVNINGLNFSIKLHPYDTWNYGKTEQFIMAPSQSGSLIHNMAFYDEGNQLIAFVDFRDGTNVDIYVGNKGRPYRVYVDSSYTSWSYDPNSKIVHIESSFGSMHKIVLGWNNYLTEGPGIVFIENTVRKENKLYEASQLEDRVEVVEPIYNQLNQSANRLEMKVSNLSNQVNNTQQLNTGLRENITEANNTITSLKGSMTGAVILSPLKTALVVLIVIAIILFAIYSVFIKGEKSEEG